MLSNAAEAPMHEVIPPRRQLRPLHTELFVSNPLSGQRTGVLEGLMYKFTGNPYYHIERGGLSIDSRLYSRPQFKSGKYCSIDSEIAYRTFYLTSKKTIYVNCLGV